MSMKRTLIICIMYKEKSNCFIHTFNALKSPAAWKTRKHLWLSNGRYADIVDGRIYSVGIHRDDRK